MRKRIAMINPENMVDEKIRAALRAESLTYPSINQARETLVRSLDYLVVIKTEQAEKQVRQKEQRLLVETILEALKQRSLTTENLTIDEKIKTNCQQEAKARLGTILNGTLAELHKVVAYQKMKALGAKRSEFDPSLSDLQYRVLQIAIELAQGSGLDPSRINSRLYRLRDSQPDQEITCLEQKAKDVLSDNLKAQASREELIGALTGKLYQRELTWLRQQIDETLAISETMASDTSKHVQTITAVAQALWETRALQPVDPVNLPQIRKLITEAAIKGKPITIIIIKCLAHSYDNGYQEIISLYDAQGNLLSKEQELLEQIRAHQLVLKRLGIPHEIGVAVADTDIVYQREEPGSGQKWERVRRQVGQTALLYAKYDIRVVSLMERLGANNTMTEHDRVYNLVKQNVYHYVPSDHLERRINKRYEKYQPLEGMTREQARKVVINSYAEEAALGQVWDNLWGRKSIHLVYKTTYLSSAMESYRNPKRKPNLNIPTIYCSGQGKIDTDPQNEN